MADPVNASAAPTQPVDVEALHSLVMQSLDDDQAVEVVTIPLAGKSSIADHMVIASGRSSRQVASMATKLAERIKKQFGRNVRIEGLPVADWVLIDADDVIVHLFRPEVRSFYNLERMWAFGDELAAESRLRRQRLEVLLHIIARGKIGRSPEAELTERYLKRISWPTKMTELPDRGGVLPEAAGNAVTVVLDERGKPLSSMELAKKLEGWRDNGRREARFLIGAADGHDEELRGKADLLMSFGPATWPHLLARAMLAEQLFRATSILANHPYHREG